MPSTTNYQSGRKTAVGEINSISAAMALAAQDGELVSRKIKTFEIHDEKSLIDIAKIAASRCGTGTSAHIANYGIRDENALIEIAKIAVDNHGWGASAHISNYGIKSQDALFGIAKIAARQSGFCRTGCLDNYGFNDEKVRIAILKVAAANYGYEASKYIAAYDIKDEAARIEIAKVAAAQDGAGTSEFIQNYRISHQSPLLEIARIALGQSWNSLAFLKSYGIPQEHLQKQILDPLFRRILQAPDASRHFKAIMDALQTTYDYPNYRSAAGFETSDWDTLPPYERFEALASWVKSLYSKFDDDITSFRHEIRAEELLPATLAAIVVTWHHVKPEHFGGNRPRGALAELTGYDNIPRGFLSPNTRRELWGALIKAREAVGEDLAGLVPIDFSRTPNALRVLTLTTALKALGDELPILQGPISTENEYHKAEAILVNRLTHAFARALNIGSVEDSSAIVKLWELWGGDLTPFSVLAARYNSTPEWKDQLSVLTEIAQRCLDGSFLDWRYRREDDQLSMFSDMQLTGWRQNPWILQEHTSAHLIPDLSAQRVVTQTRDILTTNIMPHIPGSVREKLRTDPTPPKRIQELLTANEGSLRKITLQEAVEILQQTIATEQPSEIREAIKKINGVKFSILSQVGDAERNQLSKDLSAMSAASREVVAQIGKRYVVISVITDDPKLLLMTGDLVQASSCQNYRTGSHIHTLPGYVMDGNIKLALSYVVSANVFDQFKSTQRPHSNLEFDGATQSLRVRDSNGQLRLGHAIRREVLRIGKVHEQAVCVVERPYIQSHAISADVEKQQNLLIERFLAGCRLRRAISEEVVECPASRNPAGVYTDLGGGTQTDCYDIHV
jgi:hypothetical protein